MMRKMAMTLLLACVTVGTTQAGIIKSETFDTPGTIADYTGDGKIFQGYVATGPGIGTVADGKLTFSLTGGTVTGDIYSLITFGEIESLVSARIDVIGESYSAASNGAFDVHTGAFATIDDFSGWNRSSAGRSWSRSRIPGASPYSVYAYENDGTYSELSGYALLTAYTWSIFLNQSGTAQNYTAPDGTTQTLQNETWAMYVDNDLVATDITKGTNGSGGDNLQGLALYNTRNWYGGTAITSVDNIIIRDDLAMYVPEPTTMALMAVGGLALLKRRHQHAS